MNNNWAFISYYIYAIFVVGLFSYIIFELDYSGWWYLLAIILLEKSPIKSEK